MNKIIPVLVAVIICFSVGVMASYFQVDAIQTWYPFLNKPSLTPPNFIFPIVWSILYFCMGISIGLIWNTKHRKRKILRWLFSFQLLLNFTWSIYYQLIISVIRSKRQKSDRMNSDQIRKGEDLMYLTFNHIKIAENMGDVGWLTVSSYVFYCHRGSFSQPTGNPRAARSISGNLLNKLCILSSMSLLGEMMSRKYLMMHML